MIVAQICPYDHMISKLDQYKKISKIINFARILILDQLLSTIAVYSKFFCQELASCQLSGLIYIIYSILGILIIIIMTSYNQS